MAAILAASAITVASFYLHYAKLVDQRLRGGLQESASLLYAAPRVVFQGEQADLAELAFYLRRCGYSESTAPDSTNNDAGWYRQQPQGIEIHPGPRAYMTQSATIEIQQGRIAGITSLSSHARLSELQLEPQVLTNLIDKSRDKQLIVPFREIPKVMVQAVMAAEDKRFFHHWGFDPAGIARAALVDARRRRESQGASTITQQLARSLWLGTERGWRRKIPETLITIHLEHTLSKQEIFEDYANTIYLGNVGSFGIHGFGEASRVYLGKDLRRVSLVDAALLAGMIEAPYTRNPFRYPERAKARRNAILKAMLRNRYISQRDYEQAAISPLNVTQKEDGESSDAPYFADLVNDQLESQFRNRDFRNQPFRVYTTLDPGLQRDAVEAVRIGIQETDRVWKQRSKKYGSRQMPAVQAALVALDAQTGEVRALVGGRSYAASQFNHATAKRQPGSSFKPFVYAAALSSSLGGDGPQLTPASIVDDEPTTFSFHGQDYDPGDYEGGFAGPVTLRFALAHSLNVPAVKVAEMVGYDRVARIARLAGLGANIAPTPSIALGSYEVTPLDLAGAYTVLVNYGVRLKPRLIRAILNQKSAPVFESHLERKPVVDARIAYLVENMMEEVLRSGTGAGVRGRGFYLPAAGKTGSSHDAWFAGFTSKLICVVWVGFDDNRDIKLDGARSALPIWTEFMKRAHQHPEYSAVHEFAPPSGIVTAEIDADTGELATPNCPNVRTEVFLEGTEPRETCHLHGGHAPSQPTARTLADPVRLAP